MADFEIWGKSDDSGKTEGGKKKENKLAKFIKEKPFMVAVFVVAGLGLWTWYRNSKNSEDPQNMLVADGYNGLAVSGLADTNDLINSAYTSGTFEAMYEAFEQQLQDVRDSYSVQVDSMSEQMSSLSDKVNSQSAILTSQADTIAKQQDIQAMQNNSDAYHFATTDARKKALHNANQQIASKWDWVFDDETGLWYDETGINVLYTTATQDAFSSSAPQTIPNKTASSVSSAKNTSREQDIQKMLQNSKDYHVSNDADKKALHESNQAIAKKWGFTYNDNTGLWYDETGNNVLYNPPSIVKTTSSSSSSSGSKKKSTSSTGTATNNTGSSQSKNSGSGSSKSSNTTKTSTGTSSSNTTLPSTIGTMSDKASRYQNTSKQTSWASKLASRNK